MTVDPNAGIVLFVADRARIARGKVFAIVAAALLAGLFLAVAILGPIQQRGLNNPDGALICQIVGYGFVAGVFGLGAFSIFWLSREADARVEIGPSALAIQSAGRNRLIPWRNIKQVHKTNNAAAFAMGGLLGVLFFQVVNGGQQQSILLELNDGTRLGLPLFVSNHEAMIAAINQHVTGNVAW